VRLSVQADGSYHWNQTAVSDEQLRERLAQFAAQGELAQLQIRG
jgi:biopolymer transport protein ExbD